jgi:hypothetical protein
MSERRAPYLCEPGEPPGTLTVARYLEKTPARCVRVALRLHDGRGFLDLGQMASVPALNGQSPQWAPTRPDVSLPIERVPSCLTC